MNEHAYLLIFAGLLLSLGSLVVIALLLILDADPPDVGRMRPGWYPNRERQRVDAARGK